MEAIEDTFAGVIEGMLDSAGDARMEQGASATTADYLAAEHRAIIISQASLRGRGSNGQSGSGSNCHSTGLRFLIKC